MTTLEDTLALVGIGWLALACTPRVSAAIVVTEPDEPDRVEAKVKTKDGKRKVPDDHLPPQLLRAELLGEGMLRIHFSEPLGPLDGFDPNDFRISILNVYQPTSGYGYGYGQGYGYAYPGANPDYNGYATYSDLGYSYYGERMSFGRWQQDQAELDLYFTPALGPDSCRMVGYGYHYGSGYTNGLYLHYAASSIPIRDRQGYPLANFGADWVLKGRADPPVDNYQIEGDAVDLAGKELLEISCTPELPPGPR